MPVVPLPVPGVLGRVPVPVVPEPVPGVVVPVPGRPEPVPVVPVPVPGVPMPLPVPLLAGVHGFTVTPLFRVVGFDVVTDPRCEPVALELFPAPVVPTADEPELDVAPLRAVEPSRVGVL